MVYTAQNPSCFGRLIARMLHNCYGPGSGAPYRAGGLMSHAAGARAACAPWHAEIRLMILYLISDYTKSY